MGDGVEDRIKHLMYSSGSKQPKVPNWAKHGYTSEFLILMVIISLDTARCQMLKRSVGRVEVNEMRGKILVLIATMCTMLWTREATFGQQSTASKPAPIRCSVRVDTSIAHMGDKPLLHITLDNLSPADIVITMATANLQRKAGTDSGILKQRAGSYSSLLNLETQSGLDPVKDGQDRWSIPSTRFFLKSNQRRELTLDLTALRWSELSAAGLPSVGLFAAVPAGKYDLSLSLEIHDSSGRLGIDSNAIEFEIADKQK